LCLEPYKHPKTTKLNLKHHQKKGDNTLSCHYFLLRHRKEGHDVVFFFFFLNTQENNNKKKPQKKGGSLPSSSHSALSLLAPTSAFLLLHFGFKCFLLAFSFYQTEEKKRKPQRRKNMQRKEGAYLQAPTLPFHFWLPLLPFRFCISISNAFSWHLLLFKQKKTKKQKKKPIEKEKNAKKGRNLPLSSRYALSFLASASVFSFQALSPSIFLFSNKRKKKNTQRKKKP